MDRSATQALMKSTSILMWGLLSGWRLGSGWLVLLEFALSRVFDCSLATGQAHPSPAVLVAGLHLALITRTGNAESAKLLGQSILALERSPLPPPLPHFSDGEGETSAIRPGQAERATNE